LNKMCCVLICNKILSVDLAENHLKINTPNLQHSITPLAAYQHSITPLAPLAAYQPSITPISPFFTSKLMPENV
ncbi:MAG: hypothetical protein KAS40_14105, partial [Desulfobacterales bacterium]|nr:hypothetical protein [Desulfobacterales bacterium]